jgi:hypothetical protein
MSDGMRRGRKEKRDSGNFKPADHPTHPQLPDMLVHDVTSDRWRRRNFVLNVFKSTDRWIKLADPEEQAYAGPRKGPSICCQ